MGHTDEWGEWVEDEEEPPKPKRVLTVAERKHRASLGGMARAQKLSVAERRKIAHKGGKARHGL